MAENKFGYEEMLGIKAAFKPSDEHLDELAEFMAVETPKIPAGYTYLGQFIDHDIALDSATIDKIPPWNPIDPASISNKRTPFFNLETIYGFEVPSNSGEPARDKLLKDKSYTLLNLGDTVAGGFVEKPFPNDLPRIPGKPTAIIVDQRNDDNLAVAQTHVAFIKFHNAVVNYLNKEDSKNTFEEAREIVISHYQWIILKDFLPKIIKQSVLDDVLNKGNRFYFPKKDNAFMPLEFSVAAYRVGHSMIRNSYNWNRNFSDDPATLPATLFDLTMLTGKHGLKGRTNLSSGWLINWNWFYNIENSSFFQKQKFNFAAKFDTKIAPFLGLLNPQVKNYKREFSIPALDLYRAKALGLASGQAVAKMIHGTERRILKPEQLANLLPENLKNIFSKETPFWFYLLAEAEIEEHGQTLGEVGSRIIAETFVALLKLSEPSILNENFQPNPDFFVGEIEFGMPQMLKFVAQSNKENFDELNPIGDKSPVADE